MPKRLDSYMSWKQICLHYANGLEGMVRNKDDFIRWMMTKESIGGGRVVASPFFYAWAYNVSSKIKKRKKDHFTAICGDEGTSKSWTGAIAGALISPTFNKKNILYEPKELIEALENANPGDTIQIDEGVLFLFSRTALSKDNVMTTKLFQLIRQLYLHIIVCIPQFKDLDSYVRTHRTDTLIQCKERGRQRIYLKQGIDVINEVYPKSRNKILKVKVPCSYWFDTATRKLFPKINDLTEESYLDSKGSNLKNTLSEMKKTLDRARKSPYNTKEESKGGVT